MKLSRNNYEEYFILYMDNELDSKSRLEVESFAQENPDLKAELDMLMQSKLTPDDDISFLDKDSLMRFHQSTITLDNYQEWLVAYIDNELTKEDREDAERFIAGNPSIQRELNLLQRTKLQPESIVFPYKESLYRKEEKARVIAFSWRRIAVAAVLLLAISTTAIVLINNKKGNGGDGPVALNPNTKAEKLNNTTAINQPKDGTSSATTRIPGDSDQQKIELTRKDQNKSLADRQPGVKPKEKKEQAVPVIDQTDIAVNNNESRRTDNLSLPIENTSKNIANLTISPENQGLTIPNRNIAFASVTESPYDPSNNGNGNKGGIRGFLRKVTRTIEKRTNIKTTDDDDRLLIAGVAIKL
jgi:hypothetical protein